MTKKIDEGTLIPVRIVSYNGDSTLVEYMSGTMPIRCVLSHKHIIDGQVSEEELKMAAPWGVPIAELLEKSAMKFDPAKLQQALRERGLWTKADYTKNPTLVQSALQQTLLLDAGKLFELAHFYEEGHGE